jgi:uncharacterized membrane protein YqiK
MRSRSTGPSLLWLVLPVVAAMALIRAPVVLLAGLFVIVLSLSLNLMARLLVVASPAELAVISRTRSPRAEGGAARYRFVHRGRALRLPLLERVQWMSLQARAVDTTVDCSSVDGTRYDVRLLTVVGFSTDRRALVRAVERFAGQGAAEVEAVVRAAVRAAVDGMASVPSDELERRVAGWANRVRERAHEELDEIGLELVHLGVTAVQRTGSQPRQG